MKVNVNSISLILLITATVTWIGIIALHFNFRTANIHHKKNKMWKIIYFLVSFRFSNKKSYAIVLVVVSEPHVFRSSRVVFFLYLFSFSWFDIIYFRKVYHKIWNLRSFAVHESKHLSLSSREKPGKNLVFLIIWVSLESKNFSIKVKLFSTTKCHLQWALKNPTDFRHLSFR